MYGKDFFESKVFWGLVVTAIGPLLRSLGISYEEQVLVDSITYIAGIALVAYGRIKAKDEITSVANISLTKKAKDDETSK